MNYYSKDYGSFSEVLVIIKRSKFISRCANNQPQYKTTRFTYRLEAEAKGSTVFRIPEDVYKTRGR